MQENTFPNNCHPPPPPSSHVSVTTCFKPLARFSVWSGSRSARGDGRDGDETRRRDCVAGVAAVSPRPHGRELSPDAERVKLAPALQCFSRAVAMAPDHTTNGIHSANYLKNMPHSHKFIKPMRGPSGRCGALRGPPPHLATDRCFPS